MRQRNNLDNIIHQRVLRVQYPSSKSFSSSTDDKMVVAPNHTQVTERGELLVDVIGSIMG